MRAIAFMRYGGPDVLELIELPKPVPSPEEVVVRVVASTVNAADTMKRAGQLARMMTNLRPPYVPGSEFSGYVESTSEHSPLRIGQPVMGILKARGQAGGAHAQYVSVPAGWLAPVPDNTGLVEAATVPMNGLTAMLALDALGLRAGQVLLVTGGAGAVGGYAIQLAAHAGVRVVADGRPSDAELLRQLGAQVVPRGEAMVPAVRDLYPDGVDGLIDAALLQDRAAALVRRGGGAVPLRSSHPIRDPRLRVLPVLVTPSTPKLLQLSEFLRQGILTPRVGLRLPMSEAARAHTLVEKGGMRGRVVLMFEETGGH